VATRRGNADTRLGQVASKMFAANDRINQLLIENLDPTLWTAKLPAKAGTQIRTIAAIFTHMHNVRC
jgi:hypothetical protein